MVKNLSIGRKLGLGFAMVLLLLSAVAGSGYFAIENSSEGFTEYRGLARDTNLSGRVQANMLMVRMNVKDYIITGSDRDKQQYAEYWDKVQGFMARARNEITEPQRAALVAKADQELVEYNDAFKRLVVMMDRRNQLVQGVLDVKGPTIEKTLSAILESAERDGDMVAAYNAALGIKHLLLGRLYMSKFLSSNEQAHLDRVNSEFDVMQGYLKTLDSELQNPERRRLLGEVMESQVVYRETTNEVAELIFTRNRDVIDGTLDRLGPMIAKEVEDMKLSVKAEQDELGPILQAANSQAETTILTIAVGAILLGAFTAFGIARGISRPLVKAVDMCETVEGGDLTCQSDVDQNDEIGKLFKSLQSMSGKLNEVFGGVKGGSEQVASGSRQLANASQTLSDNANQQATSVEEISSSMEEMASNISQNMDNAQQTESIAQQAATDAQVSGQAVGEAMEAMTNIAEKIAIIEEIARQTNLLALNAAIEAARAGEHGKGFAVVAAEVRKLAERSGSAAAEISELSASSVQVAERASGMLTKLVPSIENTAQLVQEIAASSREQDSGARQINEAINQLDSIIQQNASAAEELASTSEELSAQGQSMINMMSFFKIDEPGMSRPYVQTQTQAATVQRRALPPAQPAAVSARGVSIDMSDDDFERF